MKNAAFGFTFGALAGIAQVAAHTYLSHVTLDGTRYNEGQCIRPYPKDRNFPVYDPSSKDLTCGTNGINTVAAQTCAVKAGSVITVEWHQLNDSAADLVIDPSHVGPCLVYMAPLSSGGAGDVWFKIFEEGYDPTTKKWCINNLIANHGKLDVKLPSDIKAGDYLLRTEIIALHEAFSNYATQSATPPEGAQYYVNCAQVSVSGGGDVTPQGYAIPGIYKTDSPGILINVYLPFGTYTIPGPPVYVAGSDARSLSSDSQSNDSGYNSFEEPLTDSLSGDGDLNETPLSSTPSSSSTAYALRKCHS
ncbi:hypothetical protein GGI25_004171 [Coemansia spiralis]|uniref:AA9 family lytic polysaccharide monooxygenase n=2 Tax=Coemansia TaxID=4863 RepID=A0A9W8KWW5_9FUNG|nr:hypothetical protein EDC05_005603 [Coemansia umbellata]KAJ2675023.1 hypothetical protein GGI25_004171 [Coemansia spiralis]